MKLQNFEVTYTITGVVAVEAYDYDDAKERVDELYTGESLPNHSVTCNYNIEINMSGV